MKKLIIYMLSLLFLACGHDDNGIEPEPAPVDPVPEVNPFDPVEEDGAPMKVMRLKKEDFMKLFAGKEWSANPMIDMNEKGAFMFYELVGGGPFNLIVESDSIFYMWGDNGAGGIDTVKQHYSYDEEKGMLAYPADNPKWGFNIALINEESLLMYNKGSRGECHIYTLSNKDKTAVHQPAPRQDAGLFPFKTDMLDKEIFKKLVSNALWSPWIAYGVYDDGTTALTGAPLKDTGLYFGDDGVMREFFKDGKTNARLVHKCPYTLDMEAGVVTYEEGRAPSIFRSFDNKVQVISAHVHSIPMIALVVDTNGKSRYSKIVHVMIGVNLSFAQDYEKQAVEVGFDQ